MQGWLSVVSSIPLSSASSGVRLPLVQPANCRPLDYFATVVACRFAVERAVARVQDGGPRTDGQKMNSRFWLKPFFVQMVHCACSFAEGVFVCCV